MVKDLQILFKIEAQSKRARKEVLGARQGVEKRQRPKPVCPFKGKSKKANISV